MHEKSNKYRKHLLMEYIHRFPFVGNIVSYFSQNPALSVDPSLWIIPSIHWGPPTKIKKTIAILAHSLHATMRDQQNKVNLLLNFYCPLVPNITFTYPLKFVWCFQRVYTCQTGKKWVIVPSKISMQTVEVEAFIVLL